MNSDTLFDPLERFAELERLVAKIYFRFSHLFISRPELRDFWWEMAHQEDQHAAILLACKSLIQNYDESLDPSISPNSANELNTRLLSFLSHGYAGLEVEDAFRMALEIETSEIDAIYSKLMALGGPKIAQTLGNLGVPASMQRQKLKAALRRFCSDPELLRTADRL